jgi:hypothetical protein
MSSQIGICLAAAAIGISCIAPDAAAGGGGGGAHGAGGPMAAASVSKAYNSMNTNAVSQSYKSVNTNFPSGGYTNTLGNGRQIMPRTVGAGGPTGTPSGGGGGAPGGSAAAGAAYYAPASYSSNTACGRYPYPPCKKIPIR